MAGRRGQEDAMRAQAVTWATAVEPRQVTFHVLDVTSTVAMALGQTKAKDDADSPRLPPPLYRLVSRPSNYS